MVSYKLERYLQIAVVDGGGQLASSILYSGSRCRTGQDRTGQDRTGQDRTGPNGVGRRWDVLISLQELGIVNEPVKRE